MKNTLFGLSVLLNLFLIVAFLYLVHSLGGFSYMWFKMKNRGATGVYELKKTIFEAMPNDSAAIVFLGNSITEQCDWSELFGMPIKNRGISGDMADGVLLRLHQVTSIQPRQIFLMIGINDLCFISADEVLVNYEKILQRIGEESPGTELFAQSVLPVNNELKNVGVDNAEILKLNAGIQNLCAQFNVKYIDLHPLFLDEQGNLAARFTFDGLHLNGDAYQVWKTAIQDLLRQ